MRRPSVRGLTACIAAGLAACGDRAPRPSPVVPPASAGALPAPAPPAALIRRRAGGVPHYAAIDLIAVTADAAAAISRDELGEWRVWPALDGSRPTQPLPLARTDTAAIGAVPDGYLVAAIDAADGLVVLRLDRDGGIVQRASVVPDPGVELAAVVGERVVVARADQRIQLVDADGRVTGALALRGARVLGLLAVAGNRALAVVRQAGAAPSFAARWIDVGGDELRWGDSVALPASGVPGQLAVSPDARLLAYTAAPLPSAATVAGEPAAVGSSPAIQVAIVDLTSGKALAVSDVGPFATDPTLGFSTAHDLVVGDATAGGRLAIDVAAGTTATFPDGLPTRTGPLAFAASAAVTSQQATLIVVGADQRVRYLGHRDGAPITGALSPSGRTAAWLATTGALVVERVGEDVEHFVEPDPHGELSMVELVDDATAIVLANHRALEMYDIDTGRRVAETPVASAVALEYDPTGHLLLVQTASSTWIYPIDPGAAAPFGRRVVLPEALAYPLDPDQASGAILYGSDSATVRRYTRAEVLAGVSRQAARDHRIALPAAARAFDRRGRLFTLTARAGGGGLEVHAPSADPAAPWQATLLATLPTDTTAVRPAPAGGRLLLFDPRGALEMRDERGAVLWTAAMPGAVYRVAWAADGSRVLVVTQGGGEIFAAATGESLVRACGWRFGAEASPPPVFPSGVASVCSAPVRR